MIPQMVYILLICLAALAGLVVLYWIIRAAVTHALRTHAVWMRNGDDGDEWPRIIPRRPVESWTDEERADFAERWRAARDQLS